MSVIFNSSKALESPEVNCFSTSIKEDKSDIGREVITSSTKSKGVNWGVRRLSLGGISLFAAVFSQFTPEVSALSLESPVNFSKDSRGEYLEPDFKKDWDMNPTSSSGQSSRLNITSDPEDFEQNALRVTYLANQVGGSSAMVFTAPLGDKYEHLSFEYQFRVPSDFTWVKGGKLPGLTSSPDSPTGCIEDGTFDGFSARYMWREEGLLYAYVYNPDKVEDCGDYYPMNPPVYLTKNKWYSLKQEVYIGDPGEHNGYIRVWVDGQQSAEISNIMLRQSPDIYIDLAHIDTFFGGSSSDWAPTTDQYSYFANFTISIPDEDAQGIAVSSKETARNLRGRPS